MDIIRVGDVEVSFDEEFESVTISQGDATMTVPGSFFHHVVLSMTKATNAEPAGERKARMILNCVASESVT